MVEKPKYWIRIYKLLYQKGQIGREVLMRDVSTDYTEQSANY